MKKTIIVVVVVAIVFGVGGYFIGKGGGSSQGASIYNVNTIPKNTEVGWSGGGTRGGCICWERGADGDRYEVPGSLCTAAVGDCPYIANNHSTVTVPKSLINPTPITTSNAQ